MPRPKRSLIVMTSHADMGVSGKKTGKWFDEGGDPVLRVSRGGLPGSAELSSGWIGTDRSSEWALAVHDREHRPVPRGLGGDAGTERNGEPERNRLPQLRRLFVSGRLRATVGCPGAISRGFIRERNRRRFAPLASRRIAGASQTIPTGRPALRDSSIIFRTTNHSPHRVAADGRAGLRRGSPVTRRVQSVRATRYEPKAEGDVLMSNTCRRRAELQ